MRMSVLLELPGVVPLMPKTLISTEPQCLRPFSVTCQVTGPGDGPHARTCVAWDERGVGGFRLGIASASILAVKYGDTI